MWSLETHASTSGAGCARTAEGKTMLARIGPTLVMFIAARLMRRGPRVPKRRHVHGPTRPARPAMPRTAFAF